jgi:hypothetical protein
VVVDLRLTRPCALLKGFHGNREVSRDSCWSFCKTFGDARDPGTTPLHKPKDHVKILGVVMDTRLKYKTYIARAASKGLEAAIELK